MGVEQGDEGLGVVDLKAFDPSMPSTMRELLELGDQGLECAQRYLTHSVVLLLNTFVLIGPQSSSSSSLIMLFFLPNHRLPPHPQHLNKSSSHLL